MRFKTLSLILLAIFLLNATAFTQNHDWSSLDNFIENGMSDWEIPGMAVGIVYQGEIVYAKGFGVLKKDEQTPVDQHTLFGVASTTKAMTATALGRMVEEGKLDWDDKVITYLPDFKLSDPWVTEHITIRDLLTHRSGYGRMTGNRLQFMTHRERTDIMYRLRYLEPEAEFRTSYVYSNMMYMVAGEVLRVVSGKESWDEAITELIFEPMEMSRTNTSITMIEDGENAAWPHQFIKGEVVPIPRRNFDNVGASASVNTSIFDFAQWIRFNLGEPGVYNGSRIVSEEIMRELQQAQTPIRQGNPYGDLGAYGLGWSLGYYKGNRISRHGGASDGMNTNFVMMPDKDLGVVVMTNTFNWFMQAVANTILDMYLQDTETDWHEMYLSNYNNRFESVMAQREEIESQRELNTNPSVDISKLAGEYYDDLYADIVVKYEEDNLHIVFWEDETLIADLEHWEHDKWRAIWRNPAQREKFLEFVIDENGEVSSLDITFTLRPLLLQVGIYPSNYTRMVSFTPVN